MRPLHARAVGSGGLSLPADLRVQPQALAHFLMAVPEEVLERAGVLVMRMLRDVEP